MTFSVEATSRAEKTTSVDEKQKNESSFQGHSVRNLQNNQTYREGFAFVALGIPAILQGLSEIFSAYNGTTCSRRSLDLSNCKDTCGGATFFVGTLFVSTGIFSVIEGVKTIKEIFQKTANKP